MSQRGRRRHGCMRRNAAQRTRVIARASEAKCHAVVQASSRICARGVAKGPPASVRRRRPRVVTERHTRFSRTRPRRLGRGCGVAAPPRVAPAEAQLLPGRRRGAARGRLQTQQPEARGCRISTLSATAAPPYRGGAHGARRHHRVLDALPRARGLAASHAAAAWSAARGRPHRPSAESAAAGGCLRDVVGVQRKVHHHAQEAGGQDREGQAPVRAAGVVAAAAGAPRREAAASGGRLPEVAPLLVGLNWRHRAARFRRHSSAGISTPRRQASLQRRLRRRARARGAAQQQRRWIHA